MSQGWLGTAVHQTMNAVLKRISQARLTREGPAGGFCSGGRLPGVQPAMNGSRGMCRSNTAKTRVTQPNTMTPGPMGNVTSAETTWFTGLPVASSTVAAITCTSTIPASDTLSTNQ